MKQKQAFNAMPYLPVQVLQESLGRHRVNLLVQRKALRAGVDQVYAAQVQITKGRSH